MALGVLCVLAVPATSRAGELEWATPPLHTPPPSSPGTSATPPGSTPGFFWTSPLDTEYPPLCGVDAASSDVVHYDPRHPEYAVAARAVSAHDLLDQGNRAIPLGDYLQPAEQLDYTAKIGMLTAGTVRFTLSPLLNAPRQDGQSLLRARMNVDPVDLAVVQTIGLDCSTEILSHMDAVSGRSLYFRREEIQKNRRVFSERLRFEYWGRTEDGRPAPVARPSEEKWNRRKDQMIPKGGEAYAIPPSVQDALSAFYYARTLPLNRVGDEEKILLATKKKLAVVCLKVVGEETVDLGTLGRYACLVVEPSSDDAVKIVNARGQGKLWIEKNTRVICKMQIDFEERKSKVKLRVVAPLTKVRNHDALFRYRLDS